MRFGTEPIPEGTVVRYEGGSTALAMIRAPHAGGYHALQCMGGLTFVVHYKCIEPSYEDLLMWIKHEKSRAHFYSARMEAARATDGD